MQAFLQIVVDEDFGTKRKGGTGWLTSFVLEHAAILAKSNPASLTVQSLSPLSRAATRPPGEARVEAWAIAVSIMAESNPSAIDSGIVRQILSKFQDPKSNEYVSGTCAIALTRLGIARPDMRVQSADDKTIAIATTGRPARLFPLALSAASELTAKHGDGVQNTASWLSAVFQILSKAKDETEDLGNGVEALEGDPSLETGGEVAIVSRLANAKPDAIGTKEIDSTIHAIENPKSSGDEKLAASCLLPLATAAPDLVVSYRARLTSLHLANWSGSSAEEVHEIVTAALAMYQQARKSTNLDKALLSWLNTETVPERASEGAYGIFLAGLDDEQVSVRLKPGLLNQFRIGKSPTAAAKALEMLSIADLYHDAKRFRVNTALDRAKLSLLGAYSEPHIWLSAKIALARLD
jgi:hypothetical protein